MNPPSPAEIIGRLHELLSKSGGGGFVAVEFPEGTALVCSRDPDAVDSLTVMMKANGRPLAFVLEDGVGNLVVNPLVEFENLPGIDNWMVTVGEYVRALVVKAGGASAAPVVM